MINFEKKEDFNFLSLNFCCFSSLFFRTPYVRPDSNFSFLRLSKAFPEPLSLTSFPKTRPENSVANADVFHSLQRFSTVFCNEKVGGETYIYPPGKRLFRAETFKNRVLKAFSNNKSYK